MLGRATPPQIPLLPPKDRNDNPYTYLNRTITGVCHLATETNIHHQVRSNRCE